MFCRSCGSELENDWKACPKCSTLVDEKATNIYEPVARPENSGFSFGKVAIIIGFVLIAFYAVIPNADPTPIPTNNFPSLKPLNPADHIQIQPGWTWTVDRYGYSKINGSIKNIGAKPIFYFAVTAEYMGESGNVLDTSYTNSIEKVQPGNEKRFEIMHKHSPDLKRARLFPSQVRVE